MNFPKDRLKVLFFKKIKIYVEPKKRDSKINSENEC
jgi:hypothetical protein